MKKIIGFIMGIIALGLQVPVILMLFSNPGAWNFAVITLAVLVLATTILAIISAVFSITGQKATVFFVWAGITGVLATLLTAYLLLSFEITVITEALGAVLLFVSAKVVFPPRA